MINPFKCTSAFYSHNISDIFNNADQTFISIKVGTNLTQQTITYIVTLFTKVISSRNDLIDSDSAIDHLEAASINAKLT